MKKYEVKMKHSEESLTALAHMQYDLFCTKDRNMKTVLAIVFFAIGALNIESWWGLLLIAYGSYLFSSKYSAANRTAREISQQLRDGGGDYPSSKYIFEEKAMRVITLPNNSELDPLPYSQIAGLGEDMTSLYLFRNEYGGYMIPKSEIGDENIVEFKKFIEKKSGKMFLSKASRFVGFRKWLRKRDEPYHL